VAPPNLNCFIIPNENKDIDGYHQQDDNDDDYDMMPLHSRVFGVVVKIQNEEEDNMVNVHVIAFAVIVIVFVAPFCIIIFVFIFVKAIQAARTEPLPAAVDLFFVVHCLC